MTHQVESLKKLSKVELGTGDRLCRIIAKKGKIGGRSMESQGVIIPTISPSILNVLVNDPIGREYLQSAVESVQDGIIRKAVESGKLAIFDHQIEVANMIEAMRVANESVRFSKESIATWFNEFLFDPLVAQIKLKMIALPEDKVRKLAENYLTSFQLLAGRNPTMPNAIKAGLIRALEFLPEDHDSVTANEIATRLATVTEASEMLAAL
jgi:hypothetical protein